MVNEEEFFLKLLPHILILVILLIFFLAKLKLILDNFLNFLLFIFLFDFLFGKSTDLEDFLRERLNSYS